MKSDTILRLIKAFYTQNYSLIDRTLKELIVQEKSLNHNAVALKIEDILRLNSNKKHHVSKNFISSKENEFMELPKNPRNNQSLATLISHDKLRHHMILDNDTEDRFTRIEKEFSARIRLASYNLKPKKRILLYWAPGCGKTMGAERIAWNIWLPLLKVNFDSLISSFMWETASNLRSIFDMSKKFPCVLLLDECDIIAKSRLFKQDVGEMSRIVNMLLLLLDEYSSDGLLIATTNLEETLDKAIYRRFDDIIHIKVPQLLQISLIVKNILSIIPLSKKFNLEIIVDKLLWMSASSVVSISENAIKMTILSGEKSLTNEIFDKAIDEHYKISVGVI